jgi:3-hydroxyacyl-CoA dehydrogenase/enoyl-CoA hydratase/3-hydroxybutyryl-CoA epimerase
MGSGSLDRSAWASSRQVFKLENLTAKWGDRLWRLVFDLPGEKVNKFSQAAVEDFKEVIAQLTKLHQQGELDAVVMVSAKSGIFIAGADIEMIRGANTSQAAIELSRGGQKFVDLWEDLPFPRIMAIQGAVLGGGCELSLASSAIIMSDDSSAKIGLPEVLLGIIPGMGGCVRLPRKVGLATALDMILTGKTLNGERAFKAGLAEATFPKQDFEGSAFAWVKQNLAALKSGSRLAKEPKLGGAGGMVGSILEHTPPGRALMLKKAREGVMSKTRGNYPAPLEAIETIRDTGGAYGDRILGNAREKAMIREAEGFGRVAATEVSKNLIRLFFLTESVKKSNGLPRDVKVSTQETRQVGVLGAGVMGGGIAQLLADKAIPARMKDLNSAALQTGMKSAYRIFEKALKRRRISRRQLDQKMNLIAPTTDFSGFMNNQVVIEAIIEKLDIKQSVLKDLESYVGPDCVIASNTSSLSISKMQSVMQKPERFVGMHFFNPVSQMPLIEVIRGEKTSDVAVATIFNLSKQLGKTPIVVKDAPGFLVNRLLMPYLNEATWLLADGVPIDRIDRVMLAFGMPMGPMELIDEVGVDVGDKVAHILHDAFGARMEPAPCNAKIVAAGRLGKKNQKGLYEYDSQGRNKKLNPEIYTILGIQPDGSKISDEEIIQRCTLPMINEASRCLDERVVDTAAEVDLGMIMGTGFPPFRGGLLRYADSVGVSELVANLKKYHARMGARYEPAGALTARVQNGQKFYAD